VNQPTPAIVAQSAVRRLPRTALLLLCVAYVIFGFVGRDGWKSADMASVGLMASLAQGSSDWLFPTLLGIPSEHGALLPYWFGAWAIALSPAEAVWADFMLRIPFGVLLALSMAGTWYGTYSLARSSRAQPVAFAFGGQANPADYGRAVADGALLAFIACLGLAQLGHESTPALAQLGFAALLFFGLCALPIRRKAGLWGCTLGLLGLGLSGAPTLALLFGLGGAVIHVVDPQKNPSQAPTKQSPWVDSAWIVLVCASVALLATFLQLWRWKIELPHALWFDWNGYVQLLVWFTWPAWPLVMWTVWSWRRQLLSRHPSRHLLLPLWLMGVTLVATLTTGSSDRTLLLALPAMASLAAFALPTLKRSVASLIDWFTLLFFSGCGLVIWVVWIAMQTGVPSQPAANVARLAPGFVPGFSIAILAMAIAATLAWAWLVQWRAGRHQPALWKSLVLPASGAAWCWLLLMTLWMPLLNYTQSYQTLVERAQKEINRPGCIQTQGLNQGIHAALIWYGHLPLVPASAFSQCPWLLVEPSANVEVPATVDLKVWSAQALVRHPGDANEAFWVLQRR
jgi:hypothetical protein